MSRSSTSERLTVVVHAGAPALFDLGSDHLSREGIFRPTDASDNHEQVWGALLVGEVDPGALPASIEGADVLAVTASGSSELVDSFSAQGRPAYDASVRETEALADRALALLLGGLKKLPAADTAVRTGKWRLDGVSGDLWGARVGLAGDSTLAKAEVVRRLRAFACDIVELPDQRQMHSSAASDPSPLLDRTDVLGGPGELDAVVILGGPSRWIPPILGVNQTQQGADTVVVDLAGTIPGHIATCGRAVTLGALLDEAQGSDLGESLAVVCGRDGASHDEGRSLRSAVAWLVAVASGGTAR